MTKATQQAINAINETLNISVPTATEKAIQDVMDVLEGR